jgi:hypothetical protein
MKSLQFFSCATNFLNMFFFFNIAHELTKKPYYVCTKSPKLARLIVLKLYNLYASYAVMKIQWKGRIRVLR